MKKSMLVVIVMFVALVNVGNVLADGECDRDMFGNNERWTSYNAGGEYIEMRVCQSRYGNNMSHVDIKNTQSYDLCLKVTNSNGQKWNGVILRAGGVKSKSSEGTDVTWRAGAERMIGSYCK